MKIIYAVSLVLAGMLAFGTSAYAGNPGQSANNCTRAESSGGTISFINECGEIVFVIWCGDLQYTRKRCGDGPGGGYYTHSRNIGAGGSYSVNGVEGNLSWGSCLGGISFGHDKYTDTSSGSYECLAN